MVIRHDQIEQAGLTDVGVRRSHNQDNFAVQLMKDVDEWKRSGHLFLVADGMGGHAVGEKASEQATNIIPHIYQKHVGDGVPASLRKAFQEANASIHACGEQNHEFRGMGTTSSALVLMEDEAWVAHVGDSRVYRIRGGVNQQLSYDHSYVWEYARRKHIDPNDVQDLPSNVIHRCLGPQPFVEIDIEGPYDVEQGDIFLLCSDGLSGQLTDHEMGVVASALPPEEACQFLVDLANLRGGPDNITVIIVRVGATDQSAIPTKAPRIPGNSLLSRIPWPFTALTFGIILVAAAIALKLSAIGGNVLAMALFLLAIGPCVAGVIGLILHQKKEKAKGGDEESYEPHVYRQSPCHLNRVLLDKLKKAGEDLKNRGEENEWDADIASYTYHSELGEQYLKENDLPNAFREFCRAMKPLCEAFTRHQSKEEAFQPLWDKTHG